MYILAIETTGAYASVALTDGDKILAHVEGNDRFSHLQNLMPQVQQVMADAGLPLGDVTAIATSVGPGSFTGIRIGVSSSRALAQILDILCVPVSSLEALAMRAADFAKEETIVCPMLDARRSQVYAGAYKLVDGFPQEVVEAAPYTLEEFMNAVDQFDNVLIMGDGADSYGEKISAFRDKAFEIAPEEIRYQHANTVAILGANKFNAKIGVPYEQLQPEYMRIPEAERKLKEEQAKKCQM
ncbi:MAG: tRNA (adenosine(37)-N6)-threonylcarbamoyltransferase complex dimerization subunit type 1 TsaB [Eubacterium sp.]|nr:tRNA (adenosine(37)-N6)-threonylcarbamoyltransferase complex dimerization subunit type 1 TsaB [Candidatus Colimonas fimequi]